MKTLSPLIRSPFVIYVLFVLLCQHGLFIEGRQDKKAAKRTSEPKVLPLDAQAPQYVSSNATSGVDARMSVWEMFGMTAYGIASEISRRCIYGYYCGSACHARKGDYRPGGLDGACYDHDRCLDSKSYAPARTYCRAPGLSGMKCTCERRLANAAWDIYNRGKKCPWWNVFCYESQEVAAAWAVGKAMNQRIHCGSC